MGDSIGTLRSAGFQVDRMPEEQQSVLSGLSDDEVRVLTSIKKKLEAAGPDVAAHAARSDDGYVFW
jgi:hypothetical protein